MNNEKILAEIKEAMTMNTPLHAADIVSINYKVSGQPGHPFTIGAQHLAANKGIYLDLNAPGMPGCAHRGCGLPVSAHTHDTVVALKLTRNCRSSEANAELLLFQPILEREGIDGIILVETKEKFRIKAEEAAT